MCWAANKVVWAETIDAEAIIEDERNKHKAVYLIEPMQQVWEWIGKIWVISELNWHGILFDVLWYIIKVTYDIIKDSTW